MNISYKKYMNIDKGIDKAYEGKNLKELVTAPISALSGISDTVGEKISAIFNIKTIGELGNIKLCDFSDTVNFEPILTFNTIEEFFSSKYIKWARGIVALAEIEN